jgi:DNA-binding MarR family transcriptional regulator
VTIVTDLATTVGVRIIAVPWEGENNLPFAISENYNFFKVTLDMVPCIFAEPSGEIPPIQTIIRNFERIREIEAIPVVLKLNGLSGERRKALLEAKVPFVATEQIYLPFMGVILQERLYSEPKPREKLMPSSQLLLFAYLYQKSDKLYTSGMAAKLGLSAMQITRAVRQLLKLNLFDVAKDGVQVVISGKLNHRALFEDASAYLLDPVRDILYLPRSEQVQGLAYSGLNALSEMSMLSAPMVTTFAYYSKTDKLQGDNSLTDRNTQVRVEIWKYDPVILSVNSHTADPLSVIVSLKDERDERVTQAIEKILNNLWS